MILSTCEFIANKKITENLGIARGSTVRARNAIRDLMAGLKSVVGGEIEEYTKLQAYAREQAVERMIEDAKNLGFTEPDPKIDLSGTDVARKILILSFPSLYPL